MKYFDSGERNPEHTLARWLENALSEGVSELRLQTGFFSLDGIGLLIPALDPCKHNDLPTRLLIGSNDAGTLKDDVVGLVDAIGIPRNGAQLGIVSYDGAFFHPKTYYIKRPDGSEAAFVGSANLTTSGLVLHVEAGIALDTRDGDAPDHLSQIAAAIDSWFSQNRVGMTSISGLAAVDTLATSGVLAVTRPARSSSQSQGSMGGRTARPRLQNLIALPNVPTNAGQTRSNSVPVAATASAAPATTPIPATTSTGLLAPFANQNAFWLETGALTGGSRNQLDLSMITRNGVIHGSLSLFGVNSNATGTVTHVTIRYQGNDYVGNSIKYPSTASGQTNGTWRLQLNGLNSSGQKLTVFCSRFVNQILLFKPIAANHYEIVLTQPRSALASFIASSSVWDCNRGAGRHFGLI